MDKKAIAAVLEEMGTLLELQGANPFKSRAFHNGARVVEGLTEDLNDLAQRGALTSIKGVGAGLAKVIADLLANGTSAEHAELRRSIPDGVLAMTKLQGLGPKRVRILFEKLKIDSLAKLRIACREHRLAKLEGFGEKTEENILRAIEHAERSSDKHLYPEAEEMAMSLVGDLKAIPGVSRCVAAGSLRRAKEVVGDIDILATVTRSARAPLFDAFVGHPLVERIVGRGDTKSNVILKGGIACDLRAVEAAEFPFALCYFTGSKEHNVAMRSRARDRGLSLNEYGFTRIAGTGRQSRMPVCRSEEDIYKALGLAFVPPEMREDKGELELAAKGKLPKLVELDDLKGTFHCHTTASDGTASLDRMAEAARALGWSYWGVADHSKIAAYARGLTPERVRKQRKEVEAWNGRHPELRVFHGSECDILPDGTLDFPDRVLEDLDYVVVSIHSKFNMTESEATKRIIRALRNRYTTFLGHPTGRLLLGRDGYPVNVREVIDAASDLGKGIEINAHPSRLDLDWRWVQYARERKVPIAINPDAHTVDGLKDVRYGVGIARKGWLTPSHVVNAWPLKKVESFFKEVRKG